jgi:ABC-type Fe3+-siderophore transport system permease subunit
MKWWKRALRTFIQSAIGYICVALPAVDWQGDKAALRATLIGIGVSALSGGIAAVMNYLDESGDASER